MNTGANQPKGLTLSAMPVNADDSHSAARRLADCVSGFTGHGLRLYLRPDCIGLEIEAENAAIKDCSVIGAPGLWKRVACSTGERLVWDMPSWLLPTATQARCEEDGDWLGLDACLAWAEKCLRGCADLVWRAPSRDWIETALTARMRTIQTNGLIRRSAVICSPTRCALRCPVVYRVDDRLGRMRIEALNMLAADAMRIWAMVTFGFDNANIGSALIAEVDLTGGSESERFYRAAQNALCQAVAAVVETAELLADPQVDLQPINDCWFEPQRNEETKGHHK